MIPIRSITHSRRAKDRTNPSGRDGRDRMSSPHVHQREGEVPPAAAFQRLVNPDHSERLKQARVLQRAGINWLETELTDELHHLCVPKIRFCNIDDEGHQGQAGM